MGFEGKVLLKGFFFHTFGFFFLTNSFEDKVHERKKWKSIAPGGKQTNPLKLRTLKTPVEDIVQEGEPVNNKSSSAKGNILILTHNNNFSIT